MKSLCPSNDQNKSKPKESLYLFDITSRLAYTLSVD